MTINQTQENDKVILAVEGRLDTSTAPQLDEILIPAFDNAKEVLLDFSKLDYISSAGMRVLLLAQKTAKSKNAGFKLTGVSEDVMNIFRITGFSEVLFFV